MSRFLVCALAALAVGGCLDCTDGDYYDCVVRYDPYYGYYNDCHLVRNRCPDNRSVKCPGGHCECTADYQCEPGDICSAGQCVRNTASNGGGNGGGGESADASVPSSGAQSGAGGAPGSTEEPDGGDAATGTGSTSGSAGSSSGSGAASGAGGHGAGGATAHGGSATDGGVSSTAGATSSGGQSSGGGAASSSGGANSGSGAASSAGSGGATTERVHRLDFACVRDTQCGAGECTSGECYVACESDSDCGTGDRCSVETGRRICMPDPNPAVRCDESAICRSDQTCVNGTCHDPCSTDDDCENLQDRCTDNLCFPDRRPIDECVLNVECPADLVCLDGRCVHFGGD